MDGKDATSSSSEILLDFRPVLIIYKENNRVERLLGTEIIPPNPTDDVVSTKDVQISSSPEISARLYLPNNKNSKMPLLIYFHGGGFLIESPFSPLYHTYLHTLAAKSSTIILSVNYRLAPEHLLPAAYDDSWAAIQWAVVSPSDPWITQHADLTRLFLAGDSAGGNIIHHMGLRFHKTPPPNTVLSGLILIHPYFLGENPVAGEDHEASGMKFAKGIWKLAIGGETPEGYDHPWINPEKDTEFMDGGVVGTKRVLIFVAEKDAFRSRGVYYGEELLRKISGGKIEVEVVETMGEDHVFHLFNPNTENAAKKMEKFVEFLNS